MSLRLLAASALLTTGMMVSLGAAQAAPLGQPLAIKGGVFGMTEQVRWGRGWGWGGPFVAGAVIGGALAAPYYYGGGPYYYGPRPYPAPVYDAPPPDDSEAYCMQRYKSYDPNTGTYLGNDKRRHSCP